MSDDTFRPRGVREEPVHDLPRREARTAHLVFRGADGFEVAIPERLVARAVAIGEASAPLEWLGQLVGSRYRDEDGHHLVLEAIVRDPDANREPHFVSSTPASEGRSRALAREQFPDAVVVGWIHGHVRHGARYSRQDFKNQATWTNPDAIGIVVDPWDPARLAVYRGPGGELLARVATTTAPARDDAAPRAASALLAPREGDVPGGRRKRRRAVARHLLLACAAFAVGAWMGWTESRVASCARRLQATEASRVTSLPLAAPRRVDGEAALCDRGARASEYPAGAAARVCQGPAPRERAAPRNDRRGARMRTSDTPR